MAFCCFYFLIFSFLKWESVHKAGFPTFLGPSGLVLFLSDSSPKNENVVVYSPSCSSKPTFISVCFSHKVNIRIRKIVHRCFCDFWCLKVPIPCNGKKNISSSKRLLHYTQHSHGFSVSWWWANNDFLFLGQIFLALFSTM